MVIGADGRKRSHTFHRVIIRSAAKLHYEQAQFAVSGRTDEVTEPIVQTFSNRSTPPTKPSPAPGTNAARSISTFRNARSCSNPTGASIGSWCRSGWNSPRLIEEFMILANVAAAETCERAHTPLIYRVHDEPTQEKLNALREFLATLDSSLPKSGVLRPDGFNHILARIKGGDVERLVNELVSAHSGAGRIFR